MRYDPVSVARKHFVDLWYLPGSSFLFLATLGLDSFSHDRWSSRVRRRFTDDSRRQLGPATSDNRRQTRIETPPTHDRVEKQGSRYGSGGESRLLKAMNVQVDLEQGAAGPYSTHDHET